MGIPLQNTGFVGGGEIVLYRSVGLGEVSMVAAGAVAPWAAGKQTQAQGQSQAKRQRVLSVFSWYLYISFQYFEVPKVKIKQGVQQGESRLRYTLHTFQPLRKSY